MYYDILKSNIVNLILVSNDKGLIEIQFEKNSNIDKSWKRSPEKLKNVSTQLKEYFQGKRTTFSINLVPNGTEFQRNVWHELSNIPYGELTSYQSIANKIKNPKAIRAVGAANGRNPIPIIIPCHRVIGSNGKLTGFAGGLDVKQKLIELERGGRLL